MSQSQCHNHVLPLEVAGAPQIAPLRRQHTLNVTAQRREAQDACAMTNIIRRAYCCNFTITQNLIIIAKAKSSLYPFVVNYIHTLNFHSLVICLINKVFKLINSLRFLTLIYTISQRSLINS